MIRSRSDAVILTGATGFVGTAVLARYLERTDRPVVALIRACSDADAALRLRAVLHDVFDPELAAEHAERCTAVAADLLRPRLGLTPADLEDLALRADEIVHCAASVSFDQPLREARAINAAGARRIGHLADLCAVRGDGLRRLLHVSTAYVAGHRDGVFGEDDPGGGTAFRNTYEKTKHEAEALLRGWGPALPLQVLRPSIVVGDSATGWTRAFNVLYWPMRMFAQGRLPVVPAVSTAPVDVVPVDYVADAVLALADAPPGTYHAVAGDRASTVGEIVALAARHFDRPAPQIVPPALLDQALAAPLTDAQREVLQRARVFFPYFALRVRFDDARLRGLLAPAGIEPAPLPELFPTIMDFAERENWSRPAREPAVVAA